MTCTADVPQRPVQRTAGLDVREVGPGASAPGAAVLARREPKPRWPCSTVRESSNRPGDDYIQYPVEVLNREADIFRMAGHMLGQCFLLRLGLVVSVDDGLQAFPRRRD